jgi:hypothetical protein
VLLTTFFVDEGVDFRCVSVARTANGLRLPLLRRQAAGLQFVEENSGGAGVRLQRR